MKKFYTFFCSLFVILLFSSLTLAQKNSPLPDNASLDETKGWLVDAVKDALSYDKKTNGPKKLTGSGIVMTPLTATTNMRQLTISALRGEPAVSYRCDSGFATLNRSGVRASASMAEKTAVADEVKLNLVKAALLCQK
jgi:hypothetical protein